jgi:hypothetical protein
VFDRLGNRLGHFQLLGSQPEARDVLGKRPVGREGALKIHFYPPNALERRAWTAAEGNYAGSAFQLEVSP